MYQLDDTIVAVSSPTSEQRVIVRISGPSTTDILHRILVPPTAKEKTAVISGSLTIDSELRIDAKLYLFPAPHSYTGDDVAEIHIHTNPSVTETLISNLLSSTREPVRMAGPGEFTARAYLNGKIDLTQAEAVNEIIVGSNKFQLAAAEKLLAGRLAETTAKARTRLMDCLSLIEAGLDFSHEDIEFMTRPDAIERLDEIRSKLEELLSGSITYESMIDLPAVGIAGAPNSGKSSLLNRLLGKKRSIVSDRHKTTRDVLTGLLTLRHCRCVLFDCAGLVESPKNILDELAQQAATEALRNSSVVVFCVDISKTDYSEDTVIRQLIEPKVLIPVATKSDLLEKNVLAKRLSELKESFAADFLTTSAKTGKGTALLREKIDKEIIEPAPGSNHRPGRISSMEQGSQNAVYGVLGAHQVTSVALTVRHRQAVIEAIENISESISELEAGNDEVAAMMLRAAYQSLSTIERQNIDEQILERIFQRFCIGK